MSLRCMTWVFHESDARGYDRLVLLALADEADDDGADCYPSMRRIANKARVGVGTVPAVLLRLEAAGAVTIERPERKGRGNVYRYTVVMGQRSGAEQSPTPITRGKVQERAAALPKSARTQDPRPVSQDGDDQQESESAVAAGRLAELLADAVTEHRSGTDRPAVTERWIRDMRLLLERGPAELARPEAVAPARVERAIRFLFRNLADPGSDGFCWADQVRSPAALRKHWTRIRDAARTLDRRRFADLRSPERESEKTSEAGDLLRHRDCDDPNCHNGWLEAEFDPFNPTLSSERGPLQPCPTCRPAQAI